MLMHYLAVAQGSSVPIGPVYTTTFSARNTKTLFAFCLSVHTRILFAVLEKGTIRKTGSRV